MDSITFFRAGVLAGLGAPSYALPMAATSRLTGPMDGLQTMVLEQQQMLAQMFLLLAQLMVPQGAAGSSPVASDSQDGSFQPQGGTENGRRLAAAALKESTDGDSAGGWCARDVGEALRAVGLGVARGDAWTKAAVLAKDPRFREMQVPRNQLKSLPPGAIVVWDRAPGMPYGHISIALGDGREASDKLHAQSVMSSSYRVFMPL